MTSTVTTLNSARFWSDSGRDIPNHLALAFPAPLPTHEAQPRDGHELPPQFRCLSTADVPSADGRARDLSGHRVQTLPLTLRAGLQDTGENDGHQ